MTEMENPGAAGTATGVPNCVPDQNAFGISRRRAPAQAASATGRFPVNPVGKGRNFEGFLAEAGISAWRVESLGINRNRIIVRHNGRSLAVSFTGQALGRRRTAVAAKLRCALAELGAA